VEAWLARWLDSRETNHHAAGYGSPVSSPGLADLNTDQPAKRIGILLVIAQCRGLIVEKNGGLALKTMMAFSSRRVFARKLSLKGASS